MNTKAFIVLCMWLMAACFVQAQMPQAISYQAVARDAQGKVVSGKTIGVKVEIRQGSAGGNVVFSETHRPTSSQTGTINLLIGQGAGSDRFSSIDWGSDTYFLQLSMDLEGGSDYKMVSTTQMLPVPYALYAAKAGSVVNADTSDDRPSDNTLKYGRDFILTPTDYDLFPSELYAAIGEGLNEKANGTSFEFNIVYLTGTDLKLNAKLDGFQIDNEEHDYFESTMLGRYCRFHIPRGDKDKLETVLTIVNENDEKIISFPITINYVNKE